MKILLIMYYVVLLVLTVYQDFTLATHFGEIFRTPIILLLPLFLFCEILILSKMKMFTITKLQLYLLVYICCLTVISTIYVLWQYFNGMYGFLNEDFFAKSLKGIVYFLLILLYMRHLYFITIKLNLKNILLSFITVITILNVILIVELLTIPNALTNFHAIKIEYYRIRLLTAESSWAGTIYVIFCSIALYLVLNSTQLKFNKLLTFYIIFSFIFFSIVNSSKGFIVVILLSLVLLFINIKKLKKKTFVILISTVCLGSVIWYFYFYDFFIESVLIDIENYTSLSTRIGLIVSSIKILLMHPFGVGTGTYIYYLSKSIPETYQWIEFLFRFLFSSSPNLEELNSLTSKLEGLSIKSGFFQWLLIGGIFSIIYFYKTFKYIKSHLNNIILIYCFYFIIFSTFLYINLEIKYEVWLFLVIVESLIHKDKGELVK